MMLLFALFFAGGKKIEYRKIDSTFIVTTFHRLTCCLRSVGLAGLIDSSGQMGLSENG